MLALPANRSSFRKSRVLACNHPVYFASRMSYFRSMNGFRSTWTISPYPPRSDADVASHQTVDESFGYGCFRSVLK